MHEFNNRIEAQRSILKALNSKGWVAEDLAGLSSKAIDRWVLANRIDPDSKLVSLAKECAAKLFFLANKSQDQISPEYELASDQLQALHRAIEKEFVGPK
jgi:hypothetical protein